MKSRFQIGLACLVAGILIGLALYDGCSAQEPVTTEVTRWRTRTETKIERQEVKVPEAYAVVKWRDRIIRPQIDTTNGRHDTVLVSEAFAAEFAGTDSTNGGTVRGTVRSHPLRVTDLLVQCPPDTSVQSSDSVLIERTVTERPWLAIGIGPYAGVDVEGRIRYGGAVWAGLVIGSW